jgi:hypothetical protein
LSIPFFKKFRRQVIKKKTDNITYKNVSRLGLGTPTLNLQIACCLEIFNSTLRNEKEREEGR